jgi:flagellar basal-body rod protein FlgB
MDPAQLSLFDLADRRLAWISRRQGVIAENIANADTPKWQARDLPSFASTLGQQAVALERTDPAHLAGQPTPVAGGQAQQNAEAAPDGNSVSLDEQMVKLADSDTAQSLTLGLYRAYLGMFRTVLGTSG